MDNNDPLALRQSRGPSTTRRSDQTRKGFLIQYFAKSKSIGPSWKVLERLALEVKNDLQQEKPNIFHDLMEMFPRQNSPSSIKACYFFNKGSTNSNCNGKIIVIMP